MTVKLEGAHVVVTGGARGIGAAVAARLHALGARLTLMGRTAKTLREQARRLEGAAAVVMDVCDADTVQRGFAEAREQHGPVAVLVNNAGRAASAPFARTDETLWSDMLRTNLTGAFLCTREVIAEMREMGWGRVINIASTAGLKGYAYVSAYCAAKHGLVGLTRALALETARTGITVNALCPGYTETDLLDEAVVTIMEQTGMDRGAVREELRKSNPQHRFVDPDEVAAAAAWLCGPGSDAVTGQAISISGGEVM